MLDVIAYVILKYIQLLFCCNSSHSHWVVVHQTIKYQISWAKINHVRANVICCLPYHHSKTHVSVKPVAVSKITIWLCKSQPWLWLAVYSFQLKNSIAHHNAFPVGGKVIKWVKSVGLSFIEKKGVKYFVFFFF